MRNRKILVTDEAFKVVLYNITYSNVSLYALSSINEPIRKLVMKWNRQNSRYNVVGYTKEEVVGLIAFFKNNNILLGFETELWLAKHVK